MAPYDGSEHSLTTVVMGENSLELGMKGQQDGRSLSESLRQEEEERQDILGSVPNDAELSNHKTNFKKAKTEENRRKHVCFTEAVIVHEVLHLDEYTPEERANSWIAAGEWQVMFEQRRRIIRSAVFGGLRDEETLRGLEGVVPSKAISRKRNVEFARSIVLEEQRKAKQEGYRDDDYLAYLYLNATMTSRSRAQLLAVEDSVEVMKGMPPDCVLGVEI